MSARVEEMLSELSSRRGTTPVQQGTIGHLSVENLNDLISAAVSTQVTAMASLLRSDIEKSAAAMIQQQSQVLLPVVPLHRCVMTSC